MKKITKTISLTLILIMLVSSIATVSAAATPYTTYTYDISGNALQSPAAYVPDRVINGYSMNMETALSSPSDIFVAPDGKIYIADTGNSRVVVCNSECIFQFELKSFVNEHGVPDTLSKCEGVFVNKEFIYVCDTINARIVVFTLEGKFDHIIYAPEADIMGTDTLFRPVAIAVDTSGRMYIVSKTTYSGIFAINADGTFQGFVGVQVTSVPLAVRIRRMLFPNTVSITYNSVEFNNIAIDDEDFIWVTTFGTTASGSKEDDLTLENAIRTGNKTYATVKRLNAAGQDIMIRNGFFMPVGEINFASSSATSSKAAVKGPSKIVDVALGPNGMWSIIDKDRSKIYTYDNRGQLLFAFGDIGSQLGNLKTPTAITYCGTDIYVLDSTLNSITVYKRTEYGDIICSALGYNNNRDYDNALLSWKEILQRNNNFDSAYVGIGQNLYIQQQYKESLTYFKAATDVTDYSASFKELRKVWMEKYVLLIIVIAAALIFGLSKFFKFVRKKNLAGATKVGKRTFWEEVLFGFHLIMHPFDGFWDLKHEKRGSVRGAMFHVLLAVIAVLYKSVGTAYIFSPYSYANVFYQSMTVIMPLLLWCIANWCITTLFDGEGGFKDIFISTSYSLLPMSIILILTTIYSNMATLDEKAVITLLNTFSFIWMGVLIFFGTMTTHGYSMGKNILATLGTILGMVFIMFIAMLFFNLIRRMVSFVTDIVTEVSYRLK